ncbi:MAG: glycosyltransferase [Verrucomicrobiia bacterium]|jgi:sugar transferase (PEP-CTERM/EpsH1 system associated)
MNGQPDKPLKILWLKTGLLHPLDTGGKLRTYNMLKELKKRHKITYLALKPADYRQEYLEKANEYSHFQILVQWNETRKGALRFYCELFLNLFSALPYSIEKYKSEEMGREIATQEKNYDLVICDFLTPAVNWIHNTTQPEKSLLFQHNVESLIWKRLMENAGNFLKRWYLKKQWKRMYEFEKTVSARFAGVVGVSDEDCQIMRQEYGLNNVLGSVPTGVDIDYFKPDNRSPEDGLILFLGSMDWMPNIDAVEFFTESIYHKIKAKCPGARFIVVGRNPTKSVRELSEKDSSIVVTGTVEDVRPYLRKASVMVVPLRAGGGTRIKIYEAMAAGVPVVSTSIGAEGLAVEHNKNILIADSPEEFAEQTTRLLKDNTLANAISAKGRKLVEENFSWEKVVDLFENYFRLILMKRK